MEQRASVEQAFRQSFDTYGQLTKKLDIPQRDMAASLAAFIIGTLMALTWKSHQRAPQPPQVWANVRDAARANLQAVLRTEPSRLRIDKAGMRLEE